MQIGRHPDFRFTLEVLEYQSQSEFLVFLGRSQWKAGNGWCQRRRCTPRMRLWRNRSGAMRGCLWRLGCWLLGKLLKELLPIHEILLPEGRQQIARHTALESDDSHDFRLASQVLDDRNIVPIPSYQGKRGNLRSGVQNFHCVDAELHVSGIFVLGA